jgi:hypothetical protein
MNPTYIIKWRKRTLYNYKVITGLSIFVSKEKAEKQVEKWKNEFPENSYYVEPLY